MGRYEWVELEPRLGSFNWAHLDYEIWKTAQQGMTYSLVIEVIHTNTLGRDPGSLSFTRFDDAHFLQPFKRFVRILLERYPDAIDYLWLGNEVDSYLHEHPGQVAPFANLLRAVKSEVRSVDSHAVVGSVTAYHLARNNDAVPLLLRLANEGDALSITLYMEQDKSDPCVAWTGDYFDRLLDPFSGQQLALVETAWSSQGPRSSERRQTAYVQELVRVLESHQERFLFFSWFTLYDLPEDVNRQIAVSFGICPQKPPDPPTCSEFLAWQGSLAMIHNDGREKPAWPVWKRALADMPLR